MLQAGGVIPFLPDLEGFLRARLADDPDDTAAAAMLGWHLIDKGWKIRSGYRARHVSAEQFAGFHEQLRQAELVLLEAAARDPRDPAVWVFRLTSARGLELGLSEKRRRYDRLAAIDPHHLQGQLQLLQSLCPKWSGTWAQADSFAREVMLAAEPGSPNAVVVAMAQVEHWLEHAEQSYDTAHTYLSRAEVRAQIMEAAERSVLHPDFGRTYGWVTAANTFAFLFSEMGDQRLAGSMFMMLGSLAEEGPWQLLAGETTDIIRARRAKALRGVHR